ncbi:MULTISPECIES: hypothetical protein [Sphingomonas]|uniref:hypothetical protein n=1 Tax=Sphingomonas TaxID=13687 RepID=UPI0020C08CA5|nr:hypothetical protein [Sphingomonas faeni]MCK8455314.1 hypothetical protein [Sphingomonas faeni]
MTQDETRWIESSNEDKSYFLIRAQWHETRAQLAVDSSTQKLHLRFAKMYQTRALA